MKIENKKYIGDYKTALLEDDDFKKDFSDWMSRVAKKLADETLEDVNKKKLEYPISFNENAFVAFEVSVSISTFPKSENDETT